MNDNAAAIWALRAQERTLIFSHFDEEAAYSLGTALRTKCAATDAPVVIDIRSANRRLFFAALPGSAADNDDWARRKGNVVFRRHESSLLASEILKSEGRSQWPDAALDVNEFALHGGGFPVRVRGVGVVASIAISGLPSHRDHDMIVTTLAEHLDVVDVARTPASDPSGRICIGKRGCESNASADSKWEDSFMKTFNVGVIGIGDISDVYIDNLKTYGIVDVIGCAGRDLEKARRKATAHGLQRAYATPQELFADGDIDIVLNLTLPAVHAELTTLALEAGKHVYTEKPLAATLKDSESILTLAKARGLMVCCAPDTFLGARLQTCRKLIDDGSIGEVTAASAFVVSHGHEWFHPTPDFFYKPGAGPLLDIGPYYVTALVSLLGPATRCVAMAKRTFEKRVVESEPNKGKLIDVEIDTHITGSIEFANGALATLVASFDVWDSELPRIEIYGTKGTICIRDIDPVDGPNLFGGAVLVRDVDNYRWKGLPRRTPLPDWREAPIEHRFNDLSHRRNSRGIGLVDMAYSLLAQREARASGEMALHCLEIMEGLSTSASEHRFYELQSRCERPTPLPVNFPDNERSY